MAIYKKGYRWYSDIYIDGIRKRKVIGTIGEASMMAFKLLEKLPEFQNDWGLELKIKWFEVYSNLTNSLINNLSKADQNIAEIIPMEQETSILNIGKIEKSKKLRKKREKQILDNLLPKKKRGRGSKHADEKIEVRANGKTTQEWIDERNEFLRKLDNESRKAVTMHEDGFDIALIAQRMGRSYEEVDKMIKQSYRLR
jgi:DNA-directed RNA polymerase specialized sigma24 family protein